MLRVLIVVPHSHYTFLDFGIASDFKLYPGHFKYHIIRVLDPPLFLIVGSLLVEV